MSQSKFGVAGYIRQELEETELEAENRKVANFPEVEQQLMDRFSRLGAGMLDKITASIGTFWNKKANPKDNLVWLMDNTAYRPIHPYPHDPQPFQAEFVACFFDRGRKDVGEAVSHIADLIGLDGEAGLDDEVRERIAERIQPFIYGIAPARTVDIQIPSHTGQPRVQTLGPSNANGISSQIVLTGGGNQSDGTFIECTSLDRLFPNLVGQTRFAGPEGWAIISDIDDTIKVTKTVSPIGTLQTTFADIPKTTKGMPEFYRSLDKQFEKPAWVYVSASPYNLYPFLHTFIRDHYPQGTIILRDASWMFFGGLLQSLTQGVQKYKTDRFNKIYSWLPRRKVICIGDSTQRDPESYAEIYKKHPAWVKAIYIRRVVDVPFMTEKNKDERFQKAFEGVPAHIWKVFEDPYELADSVRRVQEDA